MTLKYCSLDKRVIDVIGQKETLRYLSLAESPLSRDVNFTNSKLDDLEHLDVCSADTSDDFIISIVEKCKKLAYLRLSCSLGITKEGLLQLGKLKNLKEILLSGREVDDEVVAEFQDLEYLDCSSCEKVTDTSVKLVLKNSPNLEFLHVSGTGISIETISYAAKLCAARENNVNLKIYVEKKLIDEFVATNEVPSLLSFKGIN